ncbi:hypothetical protein CGCTS75_v004236 [Colletotrichum tropicale]|nr:hypothetical protein CGCTS75_v004236 [Colletotrichum tropicale]
MVLVAKLSTILSKTDLAASFTFERTATVGTDLGVTEVCCGVSMGYGRAMGHDEAVALNYYSQWLVCSCGTYPDDVWTELWQRHGSPVFRHYHAMSYLLPSVMKLLREHDAATLFNPAFFEDRHAEFIKTTFP